MTIETWILYTLVATLAIISPGPAVLLAITNAMTHDLKLVAASSLGNITGLLALSSVSIFGLGAILMASTTLFMVVKIIGAIYLIYLGIRQFRSKGIPGLKTQNAAPKKTHIRFCFIQGLLVAITNPKPILFFTALFPSFLNTSKAVIPQFLIMTSTFMLISFITLMAYGYISQSAKSLLQDEKRMTWFNKITGGLFIVMAAGLLKIKPATN